MIQMALETNQGPIGIVGINAENLRRLQSGMPLDIDIKSMTPPGTRMNRLVVHYAHTYEEVIDDMETGGLPVNDEIRSEARKLDEQLARERRS